MAHVPVGARGDEAERLVRLPAQVEPHLPEPEEVEVVDEERGYEDDEPAGCEESVEYRLCEWVLDLPHDAADRPPLPEEEQESQARGENVRAPLGGLGD